MVKYTIITSKETLTNINWVIDAKSPLSEADQDFLITFEPPIYFNDISGYHWTYDKKLPSGRYLENMKFSEDLYTIRATVL